MSLSCIYVYSNLHKTNLAIEKRFFFLKTKIFENPKIPVMFAKKIRIEYRNNYIENQKYQACLQRKFVYRKQLHRKPKIPVMFSATSMPS